MEREGGVGRAAYEATGQLSQDQGAGKTEWEVVTEAFIYSSSDEIFLFHIYLFNSLWYA